MCGDVPAQLVHTVAFPARQIVHSWTNLHPIIFEATASAISITVGTLALTTAAKSNDIVELWETRSFESGEPCVILNLDEIKTRKGKLLKLSISIFFQKKDRYVS
jgi:hypothetical protein